MDTATSFTIGKVTGVHGLNGNLKVWSYAESIGTFSPGRIVLLKFKDEQGSTYTITRSAPHKKGLLLNLKGVDNRTLAEGLVGKEILMNRDQLPEPEADTWYWQDLIGLDVIGRENEFIGTITRIFPTGAHDILVITHDTAGKKEDQEILVPMHQRFVKTVDMENRVVTVQLPGEE